MPMPERTLVQAVRDALYEEMERDQRVCVLGEDVGLKGGVFKATEGLQKRFGPDRVMDMPLAESSIAAVAQGLALEGFLPVAEMQFADYSFPAFNQIVNEIARVRYRSNGDFSCPLVIRAPTGGGGRDRGEPVAERRSAFRPSTCSSTATSTTSDDTRMSTW